MTLSTISEVQAIDNGSQSTRILFKGQGFTIIPHAVTDAALMCIGAYLERFSEDSESRFVSKDLREATATYLLEIAPGLPSNWVNKSSVFLSCLDLVEFFNAVIKYADLDIQSRYKQTESELKSDSLDLSDTLAEKREMAAQDKEKDAQIQQLQAQLIKLREEKTLA